MSKYLTQTTALFVLWGFYIAAFFVSASIILPFICAILLLTGIKYNLSWIKTKKAVLFLSLLALPALPALLRADGQALNEIIGNLIVFVMVISIVSSSSFPKNNLAKSFLLYFSLPLGLISVFTSGLNYSDFLGQLNPLQRGAIAAPGSYLALIASLMLVESFLCRRWLDCLFGLFLLSWVGNVTALISLGLAFVYFILLRLIRTNFHWSSMAIVVLPLSLAAGLILSLYLATFNPYLAEDLQLSRNDLGGQYTAFSGRDTLWRYNMLSFQQSPLIGAGSNMVRVSADDQLINQFGERVSAGSETYFDYYLARDGIIGIVYLLLWISILVFSSIKLPNYLSIFIVFAFLATVGSAMLKNFYSPSFFILTCVLFQFQKGASRIN